MCNSSLLALSSPSCLSAVERAAMCPVRVTVGIPRRWLRLFRFIMTLWGPCTSPERHQPSPPSFPPTSFLPEWANGPPAPPHPHPLLPTIAHYTYFTAISHSNPRNTNPLSCKTQVDSAASCTQKVMNITVIFTLPGLLIFLSLIFKSWVLCNCIVCYLHTPMYVSMQYGWEKNRKLGDKKEKRNPKNFFNCHHDAASTHPNAGCQYCKPLVRWDPH